MKNEKVLKVRELMKEWERINEEINRLSAGLSVEKTIFSLFQGLGFRNYNGWKNNLPITFLTKEEVKMILSNREKELLKIEKELESFIGEEREIKE